tara:strand:- start:300 stop:539 length:240 start_codon:yes stop_codon:yes gene_type:complete
MATISIDGKEYDTDDLSEEAKAQLVSFQFVEGELARVGLQTAALQTARNAYGRALKEALGEDPNDEIEIEGDSLNFDEK